MSLAELNLSGAAAGAPATTVGRGLRLAYFSLAFPELTQTFVFNEMRRLKQLGAEIFIVALRPPEGEASELPARYGLTGGLDYVEPAGLGGRAGRVGRAVAAAGRLALKGKAGGIARLLVGRPPAPARRFSAGLGIAARLAEAPLVVCHFGPAGRVIAHLKAAGLVRAKLVTVFHGYDLTQYLAGKPADLYSELFREADLLLAISAKWRARLLELGAPGEKVATMRLGIDCAAFTAEPRRRAPGAPVRVASVGRLIEKKGHADLIEALGRLALRRPELAIGLDIAGTGPLEGALRARVEALGLIGRVRFHGGLGHEAIKALLAQADIFALPSITAADGDMEGIPVSIMEAMAMRLPVVSTHHSGIAELVEDGRSGLLVGERDPDALAGAIERLADAPGLAAEMGERGRAIVERDYNAPHQAQKLAAILAELNG